MSRKYVNIYDVFSTVNSPAIVEELVYYVVAYHVVNIVLDNLNKYLVEDIGHNISPIDVFYRDRLVEIEKDYQHAINTFTSGKFITKSVLASQFKTIFCKKYDCIRINLEDNKYIMLHLKEKT